LLLNQGRLRAAAAAYRAALLHAPASSSARKALTGILGLERRAEEQASHLWDQFDRSPSRPEDRVEALCLLARGGPVIPAGILNPEEDEGMVLRRCLQAELGNQHARAALAYFLRNRGLLDEARRLLEPAFLEHGDQPPIGDEYLALLLDEGHLDAAGSLLAPRVRIAPGAEADSPRRSLLRGIWLSIVGKPGAAIGSFQEAIQRDPTNAEPHHRLAQALRAVGRTEDSKIHLDWVEDSRALLQVVSGMVYSKPSPSAIARAEQLCRKMGRDREADAWRSLVEPEKLAAPAPRIVRPRP
jgi:tetratricopeptide (TPR) repeat protein